MLAQEGKPDKPAELWPGSFSGKMFLQRCTLSWQAFTTCASHAMSTEKQEVMGLLLGRWNVSTDPGNSCPTVTVDHAMILTRTDKREDRVEVGYKQLAEASSIAERMSAQLGQDTRVVGWYHSHPHITVLPSHVDVRTQGQYQSMDKRFIGLIFSVFNEDKLSKVGTIEVTAFQARDTSEVLDVDAGNGGAEEQRQAEEEEHEQQQQQQQGEETTAGRETAGGGGEGDAPEEMEAPLFVSADVDASIIAFAGETQFLFLGLVARSWRRYIEGNENAVDSEVATSVPRAAAALDCGWAAGNEAYKCAAALGGMEVLEVLLEMSHPSDGEWGGWGDKGECNLGECGEWGDGIFAAAVGPGTMKI
eukprot:jgi/Undpi1/11547/HiC_scaffold_30.g13844.m1